MTYYSTKADPRPRPKALPQNNNNNNNYKNLPLRKQAQAPPPLSNAQNFIKLYIFLIVLHFFLNDTKDITNFTRLTNWHVTDHKRSNLNICKLDWWNSSIIVFVTSYCEHFVVIFFFRIFPFHFYQYSQSTNQQKPNPIESLKCFQEKKMLQMC